MKNKVFFKKRSKTIYVLILVETRLPHLNGYTEECIAFHPVMSHLLWILVTDFLYNTLYNIASYLLVLFPL